jgi:hypothetical protein
MRTINSMLQSAEKADLPFLLENSMFETAPAYVDLQREQMFAGVLSDGKSIQRIGAKYKGYAPMTIKIKEKKGQPTDRITLKDQGDFYFETFADARPEGFYVSSADSKTDSLEQAYGEKIFGLSESPKQTYINKLRPETVKQLEGQLNRK